MSILPNSPVYPIPPIFKNEHLSLDKTGQYIQKLVDNGVETLMTTAGTSQYNLLTSSETEDLNTFIAESFPGVHFILGIPPESTIKCKNSIEYYNDITTIQNVNNIYYMFLYPDRYYSDLDIVDYYDQLCRASTRQCFFHGMWTRLGAGGSTPYNYSADLCNKILEIDNMVGFKEESDSWEKAYSLCQNLRQNSEIILAGGSMRRHWIMMPAGKQNLKFLAGMGSLVGNSGKFIDHELTYCIQDKHMLYAKSKYNLVNYENNVFDIAKKVGGWHIFMRACISYLMFNKSDINRGPFPSLESFEYWEDIERILQ